LLLSQASSIDLMPLLLLLLRLSGRASYVTTRQLAYPPRGVIVASLGACPMRLTDATVECLNPIEILARTSVIPSTRALLSLYCDKIYNNADKVMHRNCWRKGKNISARVLNIEETNKAV